MTEQFILSPVAKLIRALEDLAQKYYQAASSKKGKERADFVDKGIEISDLSSSVLRIVHDCEIKLLDKEEENLSLCKRIDKLSSEIRILKLEIAEKDTTLTELMNQIQEVNKF